MQILFYAVLLNFVFTDKSCTLESKDSNYTLLLFFIFLLYQLPAASSMLARGKQFQRAFL